ncbi:MAG: signal peptidase I [Planctomycetes bacterium]|nr:signal peptidase I [Planctomycetota bacterium]
MLGLVVVTLAGIWKVFAKAGKPGWAAIVPIYNLVVLLEIAGRPLWWIVLFLIPCVNFVVFIIVVHDVAKKFGKSALFGAGLWLLSCVFWPILGFGDAQYQGAKPAA